ncbi:MAG: OmpH family outer membrane protein [Meiothermus sp.]|nr:OmpH family outer membrane protein [Meiothermus sp.]
MNKNLFFLAVLLAVLLVPSVAQNRNVPTRIGYVNVQKIIEAHPKYPSVKAINDAAQAELKPLQDRLQPINAKIQAGNATAAEQQQAQVLRQTITQTAQRYQQRQQTALKPIVDQLNELVGQVAQRQGFAMVLNYQVASQSELVIYADEDLELTNAVIAVIPKN